MEQKYKYMKVAIDESSKGSHAKAVVEDNRIEVKDVVKESLSIFKAYPHLKYVNLTYRGVIFPIYPELTEQQIIDRLENAIKISDYNRMKFANDNDDDLRLYLRFDIKPRYEHIKVSVASVDDEHKPTALKAETFKSVDIATIAQEVIALFETKNIDNIELIHHEEHIFVKPTYTVEDVVEIYNMQRKIQSQADKKKAEELENYLASKTTNAGV